MDTQTFLSSLHPHADKPLVFDTGSGRVGPGYHVTEIKRVSVQGMDCGGRGSAWSETVVQLWSPKTARGPGFMRVGKFLGIYDRVAARLSLLGDAALRVEYGGSGAPAVSYLVRAVETEGDALVVKLEAPAVACKGADRSVGDIPVLGAASGGCCAPVPGGACCA